MGSQDCPEAVQDELSQLLSDNDIDFANLIEFEESITTPDAYSAINDYPGANKCGLDVTALVYNKLRWTPAGAPMFACLTPDKPDRALVAQAFTPVDGNQAVIVIGAHFDHTSPLPASDFSSLDSLSATTIWLEFL